MKKRKVLFMLFILLLSTSASSVAFGNSLHYAGTASGMFWSMCVGIGEAIINGEMWVLRGVGLM